MYQYHKLVEIYTDTDVYPKWILEELGWPWY